MVENNNNDIRSGLSTAEAKKRLLENGPNEIATKKKESFFSEALHIICEPMFLLLIIVAGIYFLLREPRDGAIMLISVTGIITIEIIQRFKTDRTLEALKDLAAPKITVIRDGKNIIIPSRELVVGDIMIVHEGIKIPADGYVLEQSDLSVDESTLTGESEPVWKTTDSKNQSNEHWKKNYCYSGTLVIQGSGIIVVDKTGANTEYGKIGTNIAAVKEERTPLQKQTGQIVKALGGVAVIFCIIVAAVSYFNPAYSTVIDKLTHSILAGITIAMSLIPEELPVILTVFLSLGAARLARQKSLVRKLPSVETLGAISILCVDKTGTITQNKMTVTETYSINQSEKELAEVMGLACESITYDPMEKAMLAHADRLDINKDHLFSGEMITEYPFTNELKMMGHVWDHENEIIIAVKGSPEKVLTITELTDDEREKIENKIYEMSNNGLRVIAVGFQKPAQTSDIPKSITDCKLTFSGLIGLSDPPKEGVDKDIAVCKKAGVRVVMITGDNGTTAAAIAQKVGIDVIGDNIITGDMLTNMSDDELKEKVKNCTIFARVIPEDKMRIVKAFKENGHIVAMTGDGVNDAPALKYADIGVAMGGRGSEVSREAADLILLDDNFSTIVSSIKDGRKIYDNIQKSIGYIFTIHVPIALSAFIAPLLLVNPKNLLFLPFHIVLMELMIDPTCAIIFERQPAEDNIMERKPRNPNANILSENNFFKSIIQGLVLFVAVFLTYYLTLDHNDNNGELARTMGLSVIIIANLFLVQVNSSNREYAMHSFGKLIKDKIMWAVNIITFIALIVLIYTPMNIVARFTPISFKQFVFVFVIAAASILWYEVVKLFLNIKDKLSIKKAAS